MTDKPIIVTGGAGFIGRNVVAALNERGIEKVVIVDRLGDDEKWRNIQGLIFQDIIDIDQFRVDLADHVIEPPAALIHLGACSDTTETDADFLLDNNYRYTRELCEWAVGHHVRFIYASSAATYGDGSQGYSDDPAGLDQLQPLNMYGQSKQMFDQWAVRQGLDDRIVGLKYFNVYGPFEAHKGMMRSMVHKAYEQIRDTGCVKLFKSHRDDYADGRQLRDFIYVKDAVDVTLWFVERAEVNGLFNCGTGQARTWEDLARAVFAAMRIDPNIQYIDMPEQLRGKYQYFTEADMRRLRAAGYCGEFTSLEAGVADYVRNYLMAADSAD
jgi:ADP-L-glycero-D-manno-heptose 6-epimerase